MRSSARVLSACASMLADAEQQATLHGESGEIIAHRHLPVNLSLYAQFSICMRYVNETLGLIMDRFGRSVTASEQCGPYHYPH